ncbi:hypothetical protein HTV80_01460 [Streptomyces sp. Vc74B-19]|uniref:hypothetical protein n=1 Tax=unclassified Streptomyces TaxID=2593676 RepID=UPI001BFC801E|nr:MULTISPECIES: hypothetical protein [unclassified Streptomyces]MBT3161782.1 hypothetical protein [Streptomyces sp. Vc74B-19]MCO4694109.1 hypothetical protein [Streptomyces sp. RO-S4]
MGLTYGYDIHLRPENVARALTEVAKLAPPERRVPPLTVTLPGGERVVLPFTSDFKSDPVDCAGKDRVTLDTSLMLPVDEAVRAYAEEGDLPVEDGRVQIGYVYLDMYFPPFLNLRHVCLDFWAATSRMSRLFEASGAIRTVFTDLAKTAGAVGCLFDTGDGAPERVLWGTAPD